MGKDMHGANGKDVAPKVPVGTQIYEEDGGRCSLISTRCRRAHRG